jgi:hypothetical protein
MTHNFEQIIVDRLEGPGWVTTRGVLRDPTGQADPEDYAAVQDVMSSLAAQGVVSLWRLTLDNEGAVVLAAARPDLELDKELKRRDASAKAERYQPEASSDSSQG